MFPSIVWLLLVGLLFTPAIGSAQQSSPDRQAGGASTPTRNSSDASAHPAKIDPAKEASIRQLMDLAGGVAAANQIMDGMQKNVKPLMTNALPPGEYREKLIDLFFERFRSKADIRQLLDMEVQIYDKYLSEEDIKGLIQFYQTPLGKKALSVIPKLTVEMQSEGMKWGSDLGRQSMMEVLSEHPDLAKALQEAGKTARPQ